MSQGSYGRPRMTEELNELGLRVGHRRVGRLIAGFSKCPIPDVCIDERRLPLFIARATLRDLIAGLEARATCGAAQ